jgi:hypothetical protein
MHLLKFNCKDKTLTEVPPGEFSADSDCWYFYVQGKHVTVPISTPDGIGEIVWQHPDYQPPSPANAMTDQHQHHASHLADQGEPSAAADLGEPGDR